VDKLSAERRSDNMRQIRSENSAPELRLRRLLHQAGYRFRLRRKDLPGKPDLTFPSRKAVIFVHGCFWHQHRSCQDGHIPESRKAYWVPKLNRNVERDKQVRRKLRALDWRVLVVWECELKSPEKVLRRAGKFLQTK
jgi:DNA mismatch endonuclease (patch repair protein)